MNLVVAPFLIPFATALLLLVLNFSGTMRRTVAIGSGVLQVGVAVALLVMTQSNPYLVLGSGGWIPPLGIVLVIDPLAAAMVLSGCVLGLAVMIYSTAEVPVKYEHPLRLPLLQFLLTGVNLSFITGDLFNLFVAFEIMLISSYALLTLEADNWDIKQAFPYLSINLFGSALFLVAIGYSYSLFGTLTFADMAVRAQEMEGDPRLTIAALLLMFVFSIKAGLFPLYFWLPNSYPTLAAPLVAFYGGMLTKVGIYVLIRMLCTVLPHELTGLHTLLAWLAGATMIFGVFGAISRNFIRGILSWHILSQVGYILLALAFFTPMAVAASIFFTIHNIFVKSTLFMIGGAAAYLNRGTDDLTRMGGLWKLTPVLGICFILQAFSIAGVPPLSGFWGKYILFVEGFQLGQFVLVGLAVVGGILTLYSMLKIWNGAFWPAAPEGGNQAPDKGSHGMVAVIMGMTSISLFLGLGAGPVLEFMVGAANAALDQAGYAEAVFSITGKGVIE